MGGAIGEILGLAVGVAISPVPVIAVILMLFSAKAGSNSVAFALGWIAALVAVSVIVLALDIGGSEGDDAGGWVQVVIGVLLLVLAVRQWRQRRGPDDEPAMPGWMSAIDEFTAVKSFGLAMLLAGPNPKNLALTIAAATTIGAADLNAYRFFKVFYIINLT